MLATQVLPEDLSENVEKEDSIEEIIGFILVNDNKYEVKTGETKIGRDPTMCSVVIENTTISKVHAIIESDGIDDTFIYDVGSTNQTKLGKKTLKPHCRYKLENNSNITFGNITVKFLWPSSIIENSESKSDLDNFKPPLVPEDIFDAVTQVTVPSQPQTSGKILQFGKEPENVQIFKTPDLTDSGEKPQESLGSSKDFIKVTACQLDSKDLVSRTDCYNSFHDASGIFSLSTQCQIIQPCSSKESKSEVDDLKDNKLDPVKDFLCDGQDDVLCTFMSLHSPGELSKKIKTEQQQDSQLFDVQTQVQAVFNQPNCQRNSEQSLQINKDLCSQNSTQPYTSSPQVDDVTEINPADVVPEEVSTKDIEEDFIKTQVFIENPSLEECKPSLLVNEDIPQESDTECYFDETIDFPATQGPTENDDLICTQKFEVLPKQTTNSPPDNEELNDSNEDLMETQLYDVGLEQNDKESAGKQIGAPLVVSESPEKNSEPCIVDKTDCTQRNAEEDFLSTQTFGKMTQDGNVGTSSSGTPERLDDDFNDDEDFIATQPVNFLRSSVAKNKCSQEQIPIQTSSRESSPDLLDSEKISKVQKDLRSRNPEASSSELLEKTDSPFLTSVKKELDEDINIYPVTSVDRVESSGEETESDLEILFDKSSTSKKVLKIGEFGDKSCNVELQQSENSTTARNSEAHENNDSNSSYIFQVEPETHASSPTPTEQNTAPGKESPAATDSDATDCEDVAVVEYKMPVELPEKITSDETQLRTLTPPNIASAPDESNNDEEDSPVFEIENENEHWSQLSLEMPNTQDMEDTVNKILLDGDAAAHFVDSRKEEDYRTPSKKSKTEVKTDTFGGSPFLGKQVDSPLKRLGNSIGEVEAVPPKKSKIETSDRKLRSSEKQFLKLWQVHDIEQIQPYRTRSSLKNSAPENESNKTDILGNNISNKFATSRRESRAKRRNNTPKSSSDITQYLFRKGENSRTSHEGRKKGTSPKVGESKPVECSHRVLRSSTRNGQNILSHGTTPFDYPARQSSSRSTPNSRFKKDEYFDNPCVNVVFTGFDCESLETVISNLGGKKTDDLSSGDVVVADKVRRTVKFLSAIALSLPITSPQWLAACRAEKKFLNPWDFLLEDEESERKWGFELKAALERSKNAKLMQGLNVYATESAKPPVKELMAIVKYCGGTPLFEPPDIWPKKTIIVSCLEDKKFWPPAKLRNVKVVHYEFILIGVLRQQLDYKAYKLR